MRTLVLTLLIFTSGAFAAEIDRGLKTPVNAFYASYLIIKPVGVPEPRVLDKLKPFLSPSLIDLITKASQAEQRYFKATKGESPPLVEGDLFTSLFEGASFFNVVSCESRSSSCLASLTYTDARDQSVVTWHDRVYLTKNSQGWLIDDIEFLGDWQFMHKGKLRDLLKQVIKDGNTVAH